MRIGQLSAMTGASLSSLRHYEEQGLLPSARTDGGQRSYAPEAVEQVTCIRQFYQAGLSSTKIRKILSCIGDKDYAGSLIADEQLAADLVEERQRIMQQIHALQYSLRSVNQAIDKAVPAGGFDR